MRVSSARVWVGVLVSLSAVLGPSQDSTACQCIPALTYEDAIASSAMIFRGRVVEVIPNVEDEWFRTVVFEVFSYWKDSTSEFGSSTEVLDNQLACTSGIGDPHGIGTEWVVLAEEWSGGFETSECLHTMRWEHAEPYGLLDALGS